MKERTLRNPKTGETITFLKTARETGGALFQMSYYMAPQAAIADEHCHPNQEMTIVVNSGSLTCTINGIGRRIRGGETVKIPPGAWHFQRNDTAEEVYATEEYRPAVTRSSTMRFRRYQQPAKLEGFRAYERSCNDLGPSTSMRRSHANA